MLSHRHWREIAKEQRQRAELSHGYWLTAIEGMASLGRVLTLAMSHAERGARDLASSGVRETIVSFWTAAVLVAAAGPAIARQTPAHPPSVTIVALVCTTLSNAGEIEVQGEVKNVSSQPIGQISFSAVFEGPSGKFISTSDEVLAKFDPLLPGQVSPFEGFGSYNPAVRSVQITPVLDSGSTLPFSGNGTTECQDSQD